MWFLYSLQELWTFYYLFSDYQCYLFVDIFSTPMFMDDTENGILSFLAQFEARAVSNEEFSEKDLQVSKPTYYFAF